MKKLSRPNYLIDAPLSLTILAGSLQTDELLQGEEILRSYSGSSVHVMKYQDYDIDINRGSALAPTNPPAIWGAFISKLMGHGHHLKRCL